MTKRQHPDTTDLIEENLVNEDASKVTKLMIEGLITSKGSDVVLTHPNSKSDCWKKFGHIEFGGRIVTDYVICKAAVQFAAQDMRPISMFGGCGFLDFADTCRFSSKPWKI